MDTCTINRMFSAVQVGRVFMVAGGNGLPVRPVEAPGCIASQNLAAVLAALSSPTRRHTICCWPSPACALLPGATRPTRHCELGLVGSWYVAVKL